MHTQNCCCKCAEGLLRLIGTHVIVPLGVALQELIRRQQEIKDARKMYDVDGNPNEDMPDL